MSDFAANMLAAAVEYSRTRLAPIITPEALAEAIDTDLPGEPVATAVWSHLTPMIPLVAEVEGLLGQDPPDVSGSAARLWQAYPHLDAALRLLDAEAKPDFGRLLGGGPPGGLLLSLGLVPRDVRATPGSDALTLTWSRPGSGSPLTEPVRAAGVTLAARLSANGLVCTVDVRGLGLSLGPGADVVLSGLVGSGTRVVTDLRFTADHAGVTTGGTLGPVPLPASGATGILDLAGLDLTLAPTDNGLRLQFHSRCTGNLGQAIATEVDGLGLTVDVDADAVLEGRPFVLDPTAGVRSVRLSLDAGAARGGGQLTRRDGGGGSGYGGVLALRLGPVSATAFGIVQERAGETSFVAVLSAEFDPAIELGLGFTLNGVGGLLGHGVTVDTGAIAAGLASGHLERLLFPSDPVAAAPTILDALGAAFPARAGGFVVGPLLALGWGRPTPLVRVDAALVLALPDPQLLLLGKARMAIPPAPAPAVIDLRAAFLGRVDAEGLLVLAELTGSRVGPSEVSGGFGVLVRTGDHPTVVVSAGGFHPRYLHRPQELAGLSPVTAELAPPVGFQMRLTGYAALTPNTLQFGGSVELAYSVAVASVRGVVALDALLRFDTIAFEVDLVAGVRVEALGHTLVGVDLALRMTGPSPWRVEGRGRIQLPWPLPDPSITFGPFQLGAGPPPPPVAAERPHALVQKALQAPAAWSRQDRAAHTAPVLLTPTPTDSPPDEVLLEPWSLLRVSQRLVPLEMELHRLGSAPAEPAGCRVGLGDPIVGAIPAARWAPVPEQFAVGQFVDLTDDESLTAPDFEARTAGMLIDAGSLVANEPDLLRGAAELRLSYEDVHPGLQLGTGRLLGRPLFQLIGASADVAVARTSTASGALRSKSRYAAPGRPLHVRASGDRRVADRDTLVTVDAESAQDVFRPWTDARAAARSLGRTRATVLTCAEVPR